MSIVTLRRADTLAESAERESLFCLVGGVRLGVLMEDEEGGLTFRARRLQTWLWWL